METLDYFVLIVYFVVMAAIGLLCMLRVKDQEDFFLGGRSFGRVMQAFAAFGAGTGANDPVTLGRTTYTSGLSGIWSVLMWLFVTPFYWIFGVWYRRMRHLTLGDWFVERYESRAMGAAYTLFAILFYSMYLSVAFSAVGKVCAPLIGTETFVLPFFADPVPIESILVPIIGIVVIVYGVLGGLRAAYWTDLIQGIFIIVLSVILIPFGLKELIEKFGDPATMSLGEGFRIMHEQVPAEYFQIADSPKGGEFPLHYIVGITLLNLTGIVVQPHFIATGGGSARTENSARVGLVVGNFMKRLCTVGWALTGLIVLALLADNVEIAADPDRVWGVAAREILGPIKLGLVGLMLACLLAALMSSADCYMLVTSGLVVRNFYVALVNPDATEKQCLRLARIVSALLIAGAVGISLFHLDVFKQLKISWEIPLIFAAPFWVGMFWRRAGPIAAWGTLVFSTLLFFVLPLTLPMAFPGLRTNQDYATTNIITTTTIDRPAAPADVARRKAQIAAWDAARPAHDENVTEWEAKQRDINSNLETSAQEKEEKLAELGPRPKLAPRLEELTLGDPFQDVFKTGGKPIYWRDAVKPVNEEKLEKLEEITEGKRTIVTETYACELEGVGLFNLELLLYDWIGVDLTQFSNAALETMRLPPRLIMPFVVMIVLSFLTRRNSRGALDRYYVKMKTPTLPDPDADREELERSYNNPTRFDHKKLFPKSELEFQRPDVADIAGFVLSFIGTFLIIALAVWVASIGS